MSAEQATTSDIAALYHATSDALCEHGTPAFGDNFQSEHEGIPIADSPSRYTLLLAGAALAGIQEKLGTFTPAGRAVGGIREVRVSFEEPYFTVDDEVDTDDPTDAYEYNGPQCDWQVDLGTGDIEHLIIEPRWSVKSGPTYSVKRNTIPRNKDERLEISLTGLDLEADGSDEKAAEAVSGASSTMDRRLARTLLLLTAHFADVAEQNDALFAELPA